MEADDERESMNVMHAAIREALVDGFWHRVALGPAPSGQTARLLAYIYMEVNDDFSTFMQFVKVEPTTMSPERLVRRAMNRQPDPGQCYHYDWALQNFRGEMVAMPSEEQILQASLLTAKGIIGTRQVPVVVLSFMQSIQSPAAWLELWHPKEAPTQPLWDFFLPRLTKSYL